MSDYQIRPFETIEEYRACVDLQEATWGVGCSERNRGVTIAESRR